MRPAVNPSHLLISIMLNNVDLMQHKLTLNGATSRINFQEVVEVADGVRCGVFTIEGDPTQDLGVVEIGRGHHTPFQVVLDGKYTIEGTITGKGELYILKSNGNLEIFQFDEKDSRTHFAALLEIGDVVSWKADAHVPLSVYEVCN